MKQRSNALILVQLRVFPEIKVKGIGEDEKEYKNEGKEKKGEGEKEEGKFRSSRYKSTKGDERTSSRAAI